MIKLYGRSQIIDNDEELFLLREGEVTYRNGKPFKSDPIRFSITCNVQPYDGVLLLLVPEGDRFKEQLEIYSNNCEHPVHVNDIICRGCYNYQVQQVYQWGSYLDAVIMRLDVGENKTPGKNP